jgi:hypothetical protein
MSCPYRCTCEHQKIIQEANKDAHFALIAEKNGYYESAARLYEKAVEGLGKYRDFYSLDKTSKRDTLSRRISQYERNMKRMKEAAKKEEEDEAREEEMKRVKRYDIDDEDEKEESSSYEEDKINETIVSSME